MALPNRGKGKATEKTQFLPALKDEDVPDPDPSMLKKQGFKSKKSSAKKKAAESEDNRPGVPLPVRPKIRNADKGRALPLLTNSFSMDLKNVDRIYIYGISFDPRYEAGSTRRARRLFQLMLEQHRLATNGAATDYRQILVSVRQLTKYDSDTNMQVVYHEVGEQPPVPPHDAAATHYIKVGYIKTLSLQLLHQYLNNPAGNNLYQEKEEAVNALNLLLNRFPNQANHIQELGKNKIFDVTTQGYKRNDLKGGLEAYVGFEKSTRTSRAGLLLNVNPFTSAFYKEVLVSELVDQWSALWSRSNKNSDKKAYAHTNVRILEKFLKGIRVRATYEPHRFYSIWGIPRPKTGSRALPDRVRFDWEEKRKDGSIAPARSITVLEYFRQRYQNAVHVQMDAIVVDVGSDRHSVYIPSNLLQVLPGNRYRHLLIDQQQSAMIKVACRPAFQERQPSERSNKSLITDVGLPLLGIGWYLAPNGPEQCFGLRVEDEMLRITGHQLAAPRLKYEPKYRPGRPHIEGADTSSGSWLLKQQLFVEPCNVQKWSWVEITSTTGASNEQERKHFLREMGMHLNLYCTSQRSKVWDDLYDKDTTKNHFFDYSGNKSKVDILFVILPTKDASTYARLKKAAEIDVGIDTTCIVRYPNWKASDTDNRGRPIRELKSDADGLTNILHKVNLRLGGNSLLLDTYSQGQGQLFTRDTIVLGADVTHPGVGSMKECPSIVAVVGSFEPHFNHYSASIRCQKGKQESIVESGPMVEERLELWKEKNESRYQRQMYPKQIIIFRDGVSEGQFQMILKDEWPQIETVIEQKYGENKREPPKVMLLVTLKRHSQRFFPLTKDHKDANGNPRCGLVVDDSVTYEQGYDFYLQSHTCIKGTARPTHYVVLVNNFDPKDGLSPEVVQREIYHHCFLFGRCPKAIGIHPAARYADMACERARAYMYPAFNYPDETFNATKWADALKIDKDFKDRMFFI